VYRHEINEKAKTLKLWITAQAGESEADLFGMRAKVVCCPDCWIKTEKVPQLPSKAPFSKRFEDAVGEACESAAARQVARRFGLPASTVRAIDVRYLERWAAARRKPAPTLMGVDEIHLGK